MRFPGRAVRKMKGNEVKAAMMEQTPVVFNGIVYPKITAVIYRKAPDGVNVRVTLELLDKNRRAVVIAEAERVERAQVLSEA